MKQSSIQVKLPAYRQAGVSVTKNGTTPPSSAQAPAHKAHRLPHRTALCVYFLLCTMSLCGEKKFKLRHYQIAGKAKRREELIGKSAFFQFFRFPRKWHHYLLPLLYRKSSPPCHNFKIHQPWSQAIWNCENIICKIFYQQIRNCIGAIDQVEYFKTDPDIFKIAERRVAATI